MYEHLGKSVRTGKFLQRMSFSAIRDHCRDKDHFFSDRDFEILARFNNIFEALTGEKLLIKKIQPQLNIQNN